MADQAKINDIKRFDEIWCLDSSRPFQSLVFKKKFQLSLFDMFYWNEKWSLMTNFWCPTWNYLFVLLNYTYLSICSKEQWIVEIWRSFVGYSFFPATWIVYTWFFYSKITTLFNDEEICQVGWICIAFSLKRCFHSEIFRKCESRHHWEKNWSNL